MENSNIFLSKMEGLIKDILLQNEIPHYRLEAIMETRADAAGNAVDMPAVRVISYFEDTVAMVSNLLTTEFDLAIVKVTEKGKTWTESFSSQQVHFMASLKANRLALTEYKRYTGHQFEIKVCSMLQDAWSGMEKELSAGRGSVPEEVKRDLYRVGAFLEMADIEFMKIKRQLGADMPAANNDKKLYESLPMYEGTTTDTFAGHLQQAAKGGAAQAAMPEMKVSQNDTNIKHIDAIDMNVDSFDSLAVSIGNIESRNGAADNYMDLMKTNITMPEKAPEPPKPEPIAPQPVVPQPEPAAAAVEEPVIIQPEPVQEPEPEAPVPPKAEGVALNIDNIETFNMNVSGMIERTTEIIRENGGAGEEEKKKQQPAGALDENAQITDEMLKTFVVSDPLLKEVDHMIAERAGAKINDEVDIEGDVERLKFLKVFTLKQLTEKLTDNKTDIVAFAEKWIGKDNGGSFDSGISLFYLEYLLVGKKNDPAFAVEYVLKFISDNDYSARYIIPTYNAIRHSDQPTSFSHLTLK